MKRGKILALDYGTKNVGVACCDEFGIAVRPLASLPNRGKSDLLLRVRSMVSENDIKRIIIGLPLNMDGTSGEAAERVDRFVKKLHSDLAIPVTLVDERLSTVEAKEIWNSMNQRKQRKYRTIDSLAAALILERFLREL